MPMTTRSITFALAAAVAACGSAHAAPQENPQYESPRDVGQDSGRGEHCRDVEVTRRKPEKDKNRVAGTAIGAVAGGVVGNQVGKGKGKTLATVAGAVGGGVIGNKVQKNNQRNDTETVIERRCD